MGKSPGIHLSGWSRWSPMKAGRPAGPLSKPKTRIADAEFLLDRLGLASSASSPSPPATPNSITEMALNAVAQRPPGRLTDADEVRRPVGDVPKRARRGPQCEVASGSPARRAGTAAPSPTSSTAPAMSPPRIPRSNPGNYCLDGNADF